MVKAKNQIFSGEVNVSVFSSFNRWMCLNIFESISFFKLAVVKYCNLKSKVQQVVYVFSNTKVLRDMS